MENNEKNFDDEEKIKKEVGTLPDDVRLMTPADHDWPRLLNHIHQSPKRLFVRGYWPPRFADGTFVNEETKFLCVVGARRHSAYGREVCETLIAGLAEYNICIVSGLALGLDSVAHEAALSARIPTISFPGSGLDRDVMYPPRNQRLADRIVASGGALLSEYDMDATAMPWFFPERNRLMAGISHAVLVVEAKRPSGTLLTAKRATESNRDVYAVPGDIFSPLSAGPHMLIDRGAAIVTSSVDILHQLGIKVRGEEEEGKSENCEENTEAENVATDTATAQSELFENEILRGDTNEEKILFKMILAVGRRINRDLLIRTCVAENPSATVATVSAILSNMEINGLIREENGDVVVVK